MVNLDTHTMLVIEGRPAEGTHTDVAYTLLRHNRERFGRVPNTKKEASWHGY